MEFLNAPDSSRMDLSLNLERRNKYHFTIHIFLPEDGLGLGRNIAIYLKLTIPVRNSSNSNTPKQERISFIYKMNIWSTLDFGWFMQTYLDSVEKSVNKIICLPYILSILSNYLSIWHRKRFYPFLGKDF